MPPLFSCLQLYFHAGSTSVLMCPICFFSCQQVDGEKLFFSNRQKLPYQPIRRMGALDYTAQVQTVAQYRNEMEAWHIVVSWHLVIGFVRNCQTSLSRGVWGEKQASVLHIHFHTQTQTECLPTKYRPHKRKRTCCLCRNKRERAVKEGPLLS